jgi:hypothetical protein
LGGLPAGLIDRAEKDIEPWQKSIEATQRCLQARARPLVSVDELRRCMEELAAADYRRLSQFERWAESLVRLLVEKKVLTRAEMMRRCWRSRRAPRADREAARNRVRGNAVKSHNASACERKRDELFP